jgi:hypothetical protein
MWTGYAAQPQLINAAGGVDAAVRTAYPPFPRTCQRVVLVRGPVLLWGATVGAWQHSRADAYALVQEGDVVEVQLYGRAAGPDTKGPGRAVVAEDHVKEVHRGPPAATNTNAMPVNGRRNKGVTADTHHCVGHCPLVPAVFVCERETERERKREI